MLLTGLSGGGILAPNSVASMMGSTEDGGIILSWDWSTSGGAGWNAWKFVLEILRTYVEDRTGKLGIKRAARMNDRTKRGKSKALFLARDDD
jgi:hypothetical protein